MMINSQRNDRTAIPVKQDVAILIVDDEPGIRDFLQRALCKQYHTVDIAESTEEADRLRAQKHFDVLIVDICMPGRSGVSWIEDVRVSDHGTDVIFMTAFADISSAIKVLHLGASDLILKPFRIEQMRSAVKKCLDSRRLVKENFVLNRQLGNVEQPTSLVGESSSLKSVLHTIERVAPAPSAVLLEGETGTGKELAAREIHRQSGRTGAFVPVNCAALAAELMESELFGHIKGAFTSAHQTREGLFSYADGGTLFLDEISEMPLAMQSKLLRVLEDGCIRPLGTERHTPINVRVIAASNKNLAQAVEQGQFRQDLYYRLNVLTLNLPSLRERPEDIPILCQHLMQHLSGELGIPAAPFDAADISALQGYSWPGNVRELRNVIERGLLLGLSPAQLLLSDDLAKEGDQGYPLSWTLKQVELNHIERVLVSAGGNKTKAAQQLGITRKTLDRKRNSGDLSD